MRGTSRNEEVDWKDIHRAVENLGMIAEWTACNCTSADRYHDLGFRHRLVSLFERQAHVLGDSSSNQKSIRMAWGRHKLNAESAEIEHHGIKNIDVRLASIASAGADLSQLERSTKDPVGLFSKVPGKAQRFPFGQDQIVSIARRESVLQGETDRSCGTCVGTLGAEQTAPEIDLQTSVAGNCVGRASIRATRARRWTSCLIQDG